MAKIGRPKKEIDFNIVESLCKIQCTGEEIASVVGVDYDTLAKRIKSDYGESFTEYYKRFSGAGKASLRRLQFKLAERNAAMAIWLGKQYLDQREPKERIQVDFNEIPNVDGMTDEEVERKFKIYADKAKAVDS